MVNGSVLALDEVLCEGHSPVVVAVLASSDVPVLGRPVSLPVSNCLSSQPQAYLQQAQDLVILESIILQTLGKFGRKSRSIISLLTHM